MSINYFYPSAAGRLLLAQAVAGATITITRAQIGEGTWPEGTNHDNITALAAPLKELTIAKKSVDSNGQVKLTLQFSNSGIGRSFKWTEFAIWAADPEYPDDRSKDFILGSSYATADEAKPIDAGLTEFQFSVILKIGSAENVQVLIDESLIYIDMAELKAYMATVSPAKIKKDFTIPTSAWILTDTNAGGLGKYKYVAEIDDPDATENHFPNLALDVSSLEIAHEANLCPTIETLDGKIRLWAQSIPTGNLTGTIILTSENLNNTDGSGGADGGDAAAG